MSAAATAAGYLYASGRLRGRAAREQEEELRKPEKPQKPAPQSSREAPQPSRERVRVAVLPASEDKPRRTPKIEYRTRKRWSPE